MEESGELAHPGLVAAIAESDESEADAIADLQSALVLSPPGDFTPLEGLG